MEKPRSSVEQKKTNYIIQLFSGLYQQYISAERKNLKRIMVRDGICGESANGLKNGCRRWSVWVWVGQAGRSENCCRNFKLILCCFWSIISPHTKFRPNPMKNAVVENFHHWSGLVGWAGRSKNGRRHFKLHIDKIKV